jgi:hypothetical protein
MIAAVKWEVKSVETWVLQVELKMVFWVSEMCILSELFFLPKYYSLVVGDSAIHFRFLIT